MSARTRIQTLGWMVVVFALVAFGQERPTGAGAPATVEFPINFKQKVEAGKTPVGTKVQAELAIATLLNGKTVPRNAVFSGEVVESVAKTATEPSQLALRMDSVQWKNGSASLKAYLTAWFYPVQAGAGPDLAYGPTQSEIKTWNGMGAYPDSQMPGQRFPDSSVTDPDRAPADSPATRISNRRVVMKDIESTRREDGTVVITSKRNNIKLDKLTTYVIATGDLLTKR
ncbi:MAG TPA: hypothetical protein VLT90_06915 [Terriglobales bacterium]|nr:hypothetical protein [Terriglobales bacterium]